jgi:NADH dehydrogenase
MFQGDEADDSARITLPEMSDPRHAVSHLEGRRCLEGMTEHTAHKKVVVIGGGYSGTLAANHLRMRGDIEITLVNPRPTFVERIRLHQLVAGTHEATVDYGSLLGEGIKLVVDTATRIDTANRTVELASGQALDYDYVIYAVGSTGMVPASVPGAAEFAYPLAELEQAQRLRAVIDDLHPDAPVTVVGAGLTGIEAATELAEQGRKVTLVCGGQLGPYLSEPGRRSVAKVLAKLGVNVLEADVVTEVRQNAVVFADGAVRPTAVTIWVAGFGVPDLAATSGLHTDAMGRLITDETLTSVDDPRIVATGDCAAPSGQPLRMSCQSASPLGAQAANTVLSRVAGTAPAVIDQAFTGACISLGRNSGILQFARKDDTAVNLFFSGRIVASVKEAVCKGTVWALRREAAKPGSAFWFKGGPRPEQPVFAPKVVTET